MQCDYYNVSIQVLQQYVKTQHLGNFTTSDIYYNRFSQLGKPSVYHTPRRSRLQFYDVIFSLVVIRLSRSLVPPQRLLLLLPPLILQLLEVRTVNPNVTTTRSLSSMWHNKPVHNMLDFYAKRKKKYKLVSVCTESCREHRVFWGHIAHGRSFVSERHGCGPVARSRSAGVESCVRRSAKQKACCSVHISHIIQLIS